jgi:hypothetical protein
MIGLLVFALVLGAFLLGAKVIIPPEQKDADDVGDEW